MAEAALDAKVRLPIQGSASFPDGLKIFPKGFNRMRPRTGGPVRATAAMTLISPRGEEPFRLSIFGTDGKPEFALVGWEYGGSVEIAVKRFNTIAASYAQALDLRAGGSVALFDDAFKIRIAETGSETSPDGRTTSRSKAAGSARPAFASPGGSSSS